jgi:hypothetical protein
MAVFATRHLIVMFGHQECALTIAGPVWNADQVLV